MKVFSKIIFILFFSLILVGCTVNHEGKKDTEEFIQSSQDYVQGITQETSYGKVRGYENKENNTLVWKGIPYAKAPLNELRWKAPEDPESYSETFDATKSGNVCIQSSAEGTIGSEDCLNLDIYRPNTDEEDLPVFFFIHGGNNQTGNSEEIAGDSFVNDLNVIFVSINYRLGPLGFNPLLALRNGNDLEDSGNYTMLDIAKSLDWVKENIKSFGGDPNNITISGFSAGGRDVMATLISPIFEDKFQKAIVFSGGMTIADQNDSVKVFAKAIAPLVVEDGVKAREEEAYEWLQTEGEDVKEYLYSVSSERLSKLMNNAGIRMSAFPHLYNDGNVLPKEKFETHDYHSVPIIMLSGTTEFSLFAMGDPYFSDGIQDGSLFSNDDKYEEFAFAKRYGSKLYTFFNTQESALTMYDNYEAPIYNIEIPFGEDLNETSDMKDLGSFHGVFVPLLDNNNTNYASMVSESYDLEGAEELSEQFKMYLSNFIHNGDPNGEGLTEWKPWTDDQPANLVLTADEENSWAHMSEVTTTKKDIIKEIEADTSISSDAKRKIIKEVLNGRWFSHELDLYFENDDLWIQ